MDSKKFGILFGAITLAILLVIVNMTFYHVSLNKFDDKLSEKFKEYEASLEPIDELLAQEEAAQELDSELPQTSPTIVEEKSEPIDYFNTSKILVPEGLVGKDFDVTGSTFHPLQQNIIYYSTVKFVGSPGTKKGITTTTQYHKYDFESDVNELLYTKVTDDTEKNYFSDEAIGAYGVVTGFYIDANKNEHLIVQERPPLWSPDSCAVMTEESSESFRKVLLTDFEEVTQYTIPDWVIRQSEIKAKDC